MLHLAKLTKSRSLVGPNRNESPEWKFLPLLDPEGLLVRRVKFNYHVKLS